ncbi:putative zinc finger in N-recognin-domain-containing protein [Lipomyces arxii]|uniref:putative zinc finger in N-recognin-domain-containing protein n=1 Tax=Lipomyces arxii TaxID=56418 RepID=UPI0034CE1545
MAHSESAESPDSITALDYVESQLQLEHDARDVLPYDPTHCTYFDGGLRQPVYACLTCINKSKTLSGVCYSCSIQCHSDHDLVELFNKRNFTCDCGTARMASFGGCNLRKNYNELDIPSSSNKYDHNFQGKFCACDTAYNPESAVGTMYQCLLGDVCNEDWYHEECILGLPFPPLAPEPPKSPKGHPTGVDLMHLSGAKSKAVPHAPKGHPTKVMLDLHQGERIADTAETREPKSPQGHPTGVKLYPLDLAEFELSSSAQKPEPASPTGHPTGVNLLPQFEGDLPASVSDAEQDNDDDGDDDNDDDEHVPPPGFPDDDLFEAFICWRCVNKHRQILGRWAGWSKVALKEVVRKQPGEENDERDLHPAEPSAKRKLYETEMIEPPAKKVQTDNDKSLSASISSVASSTTHDSSLTVATEPGPDECHMPVSIPSAKEFSLFLIEGWRDHVCRCTSCMKFLDKFPMLKDEEVTYEPPKDEDETLSLLDAGTRALGSLPHLNAMEGLYAYNKVKTKLASFLKPFADEGRIVSEQDVKAFFEEIKSK